jgi:threonine dehydrogenase-like Zn-dependent dehydrogenase
VQQLFFVEPGKVEWREVPDPSVPEMGALVRPTAVAMCDLDSMLIYGGAPIPGPFEFGHEFVGEVVEVGEEDGEQVSEFKAGDRVIVSFQICCGKCDRCQRGLTGSCREVREGAMYGLGPIGGDWGGAFADLVKVPYEFMLLRLPDSIADAVIASGNDNLPDAYRTVVPQLEEFPGGEVLILGGGGRSIALYAVMMAIASGASKVDYVDDNTERLGIAEQLGANSIEGPPPSRMGRYQVTVDATGNPDGLATALRSTDSGGVCTSIGIYFQDPTIPFLNMYTRGITFKTGRPHSRATMPEIIRLIDEKKVDPSAIQTVAGWDELPEALEKPPLKLIVTR